MLSQVLLVDRGERWNPFQESKTLEIKRVTGGAFVHPNMNGCLDDIVSPFV